MINLLETRYFKCLRNIRQNLSSFQILVGPNASGKTTFLDVISFFGRMISDGPEPAIEELSNNFYDLIWGREGDSFELALEATIPDNLRQKINNKFNAIRYEVSIGVVTDKKEVGIIQERAILKNAIPIPQKERLLFPENINPPNTILSTLGRPGEQTVLSKAIDGNDNFYSEPRVGPRGKGWIPSFKLGHKKSTLGNLFEDENRFPVATWLKLLLTEGIQKLVLNSLIIRKASPPGQYRGFKPDGSNLPWVIEDLRKKDKSKFREWILHVQTALPDIVDIFTVERKDDKHRYLKIKYNNGLELPSWLISDGTLRLLALTLPAYLPETQGIYLIEEPENGINPTAIETLLQSLSSVYNAQILLATHSPIILSQAKLNQILCFRKTDIGATDIILGTEHPKLKNWKGQPNLDIIFVSGIL